MSDAAPELTRPVHRIRARRTFALGAAALACFAAGLGVAVATRAPSVAPKIMTVATPVNVTLPAAPPITVVAPSPPLAAVPDEVAPLAEPPPPRAVAPRLDAACIAIYTPDAEPEDSLPSCTWDDGFPAVSDDATTLVTKVYPDDGGRGNPSLTIRFLDVATSKVLREVVVLDPDEIELLHDEKHAEANRAKLIARVARRAAQAQALIDAGRFRTLQPLGSVDVYGGGEVQTDRTRIYAEFDEAAVRAVDPATNTVLWQGRFDAPAPKGTGNPASDCAGWGLRSVEVAWDPETRIVMGTTAYDTGGCMCETITSTQIRRMP